MLLLAAAAAAAALFATPATAPAAAPAAPNLKAVVFVLVDDWGYNDVGFRSTDLKTPTIDALAATGVKLMSYYTQPICTPARTALMTSRYPIRSGMWHNVIGVPAEPWGLPTNESTFAEGMRELGFSTHIVGKWHLGSYQNASLPTSRGFDSQFGYLAGEEDYWTHVPGAPPGGGTSPGNFFDLQASTEMVQCQNGSYSAFLFEAVAENIVRNHDKAKGLFLYYAMQTVHSPLEAPDEWLARCPVSAYPNPDRRTYAAMTLLADSAIHNLTLVLTAEGLMDDTVMVIAGDVRAQAICGCLCFTDLD